jgi:hypothetical protein
MNSQERIIRKTVEFIFDQYISGYNNGNEWSKKIESKVLVSEKQIIEAVYSKQPYFIADEVLYFFLAINQQLIRTSECLLIEKVDVFPLFPFPLVCPLSLSPKYLDLWQDMETYMDLFIGEHWFLRTPRLEQSCEQAPIYCLRQGIDDIYEEDSSGIICYSSLTSLLLMVAECYRTGAYYFDFSWKEDLSKSQVIFQKFNEGLMFRSPNSPKSFF